MTCKSLVLSALALTLAFSETSRALDIRTGRYITGRRINAFVSEGQKSIVDPELRITRNGSIVEIFDIENKITYQVDLNNPGEQTFPQEYYDLQKNSKALGALMNTIKSIRVENVHETDDKLTANINVYLQSRSIFGGLRGKIIMSVELESAQCDFTLGRSSGSGFSESKSKIPCIHLAIGNSIELGQLALDIPGVKSVSALAPILTNTAGIVIDLALKLTGFGINTNIIRIPRF